MSELNKLMSISSGYTFRDAILNLENGQVAVIQAGDINSSRLTEVTRIKFDGSKHLLEVGDVLLSARGQVVARTVTPDLLPAVAASSVFVLRPISSTLNSRYIARYLNSKIGQNALKKISSGSSIKTLTKFELSSLEIPMPPIETQSKIVELGLKVEEQQLLLTLKQELVQQVYDGVMYNVTKGQNR